MGQFANIPDLKTELLNAIMSALDANNQMSTQVFNSPTVQSGMKDILLNHAGLLGDAGVKYHLAKLSKAGRIRHAGPPKAGRWDVLT